MTRELIIVGASVRAATFSAIRAGFQPYAIDQYADRDLAAVCPAVRIGRYPHDLARALGDAPAAPWIYTGGLENHPRLVDDLAAIRPLFGNPGSVLRRVRNPFLLADVLQQANFQFPPIARELSEHTAQHLGPHVLKKPIRSSGGSRITIVAGPQPAAPGYYYQRYLPGCPWSTVFVARAEKCHLLGVSRQIQSESGGFAYQGSIVSATPDLPEVETLVRLGALVAAEFEMRGLFNIDLMRSSDGWWLLEVNPRYSASVEVLERAAGVQFIGLHAASFATVLGEVHPPVFRPVKSVGKAIVYANDDGVVPPEFEGLIREWNTGPHWPAIADLPRVGEPVSKGQPICTVFAEARSSEEVENALRKRSSQVRQVVASARLPTG